MPSIYQVFCDSRFRRPKERRIPAFSQVFSARVFRYDKYLVFPRCLATCLCMVVGTENTRYLPGQGEESFPGGKFAPRLENALETKVRGLKFATFCDILPKMLGFSRLPGFYLVKTSLKLIFRSFWQHPAPTW